MLGFKTVQRVILGSLMLLGCSLALAEELPAIVDDQDGFPVFDDTALRYGQDIWMNTCRNCHERGVADAPIVKDYSAWEWRIAKGKPTLYDHAINGFFGEDDSMMPAKGGNPKLSDDDVKAAVDYMVAVATSHKP